MRLTPVQRLVLDALGAAGRPLSTTEVAYLVLERAAAEREDYPEVVAAIDRTEKVLLADDPDFYGPFGLGASRLVEIRTSRIRSAGREALRAEKIQPNFDVTAVGRQLVAKGLVRKLRSGAGMQPQVWTLTSPERARHAR